MRQRLVLLHGFTQTARSWDRVAESLATSFDIQCPDLPGHAGRDHYEANLWDVAGTIASQCGAATYVGYSFGARTALHVALAHPERVERLVLLGGTAGLREPEARAARVRDDEALARSLESGALEAFIDRWLANPLFSGLSPEGAMRSDRLRNEASGLAASLRRCGTGTQENLWPRLGELRMPVLLLAGELDTKFAAIAQEMAPLIGRHAETALVAGAGHTAHLEQPEAFLALLRAWLERTV